MAQHDQTLIGGVVRSIDKKVEWEVIPAQNEGVRVTLRLAQSETHIDLSRDEISGAADGGAELTRLREKMKRVHRRLFRRRHPYMPWVLPKIEPVGAVSRPYGGGGGGGGRPRR